MSKTSKRVWVVVFCLLIAGVGLTCTNRFGWEWARIAAMLAVGLGVVLVWIEFALTFSHIRKKGIKAFLSEGNSNEGRDA